MISWMGPGRSFEEREEGSYIIDSVTLGHEGVYTCVVYFSTDDITAMKTVHLKVVGEHFCFYTSLISPHVM